jgi:hypothetical protein
MQQFGSFVSCSLPAYAEQMDAEQQRAVLDPREYGLVPGDGDTVPSYGWTCPGREQDFGALYLTWRRGTPRGHWRAHGAWVLLMSGVTNGSLSFVDKANWDDAGGFARLADRVIADNGEHAIMVALTNQDQMREESAEWFQARAAARRAAAMPASEHTPYTSVAKRLKAADVVRGATRWRDRMYVMPVTWPGSDRAPAVVVRGPENLFPAVRAALSPRFYEVTNLPLPGTVAFQVWAANPDVFNGDGEDLLHWAAKASLAAARVSRGPRRARV